MPTAIYEYECVMCSPGEPIHSAWNPDSRCVRCGTWPIWNVHKVEDLTRAAEIAEQLRQRHNSQVTEAIKALQRQYC